MDIRYLGTSLAYSVNSSLLFQTGTETPLWSDALFYFYPQLDKEQLTALPASARADYLTRTLRDHWEELQPLWQAKLEAYNARWQTYRSQIEAAFSEAFEVDAGTLFNDLTGYITLNPVCPRFLREHSMDVFHLNSERGALGVTIHEMIHFLWFHVWHAHFRDSYDEYETPSLKWILSEMVVESIMRDPRLSSINPYFPRENGGCVYAYFQNMVIGGRPILDTLDDMYRARKSIQAFMEESFAYCQAHESAIRAHIAKEEQNL